MNSTVRKIAVAATLGMAFALAAHAHPHVFISGKASFGFTGAELTSIGIRWTFDDVFSQMVAADYDKQNKGSFTASEASELQKGAFDNLKNYHYFLALFVDGRAIALPPIRNFVPSIEGGRLVYSFQLPLGISIPPAGREIRLTIYDDTYYVAFDKMSPADISEVDADALDAAVSIEKTKVKASWPGQFMPDQIVLRIKRK